MPGATEIPTLAGTMDELARRGFTEHFIPANGKLRAADSGKVFPADEAMISEYHRFEGVSDPDADAFGVYADPAVGAFMKEVVRGRRS